MYIRVTSRKNKDNSVVKYVQLAHNVRNPKSGSPQAEVIHNFGRLDELDMDVLRRLARSIQRFLGEDPTPTLFSESTPELKFLSSRPMGGAYFLDELWHRIGIDQVLKKRLKDRLAEKLNAVQGTTLVLVMGSNFQDALSISSFVAQKGWPMLLVGEELSSSVEHYIQQIQPEKIILAGGNESITPTIEAQLGALFPKTKLERVGGENVF